MMELGRMKIDEAPYITCILKQTLLMQFSISDQYVVEVMASPTGAGAISVADKKNKESVTKKLFPDHPDLKEDSNVLPLTTKNLLGVLVQTVKEANKQEAK